MGYQEFSFITSRETEANQLISETECLSIMGEEIKKTRIVYFTEQLQQMGKSSYSFHFNKNDLQDYAYKGDAKKQRGLIHYNKKGISDFMILIDEEDDLKFEKQREVLKKYLGIGGGGNVDKVINKKNKNSFTITLEQMKQIFTNAKEENLRRMLIYINKYCGDVNINTPLRMAHFLAQVGHESGQFSSFIGTNGESGCYTKSNKNWSIFFSLTWKEPPFSSNCISNNNLRAPTDRSETRYGRVKKLKWHNINEVPDEYIYNGKNSSEMTKRMLSLMYCCEGGNGCVNTEDGYKYRGHGIMQLTWKNTYIKFDKWLKSNYPETYQDVVTTPDLVATNEEISVLSALWEWDDKNLNKFADKVLIESKDDDENFNSLTKKINTGTVDIDKRFSLFKRAINILL